jgi:hypothetical protein
VYTIVQQNGIFMKMVDWSGIYQQTPASENIVAMLVFLENYHLRVNMKSIKVKLKAQIVLYSVLK